ncbi:MAG: butyrate kinase [Synergistaceae bacterium]
MKIFTINPGATTTKIALFEDTTEIWRESISYTREQLSVFNAPEDEEDLRYEDVIAHLNNRGIALNDIDAFVGRGGLLHPISGGTWIVTDDMIEDLKSKKYGSHASNLGCILALRMSETAGKVAAYTVDPVCVDEMPPIAHISGIPSLPRVSIFHALNQKAVAHRVAAKLGKKMEECKFIIAHMGGGITVGAHYLGRVIDVNNALGGYGPMTPERSGTVHGIETVKLCFSGKYTEQEVRRMLVGDGGLYAHLATTDFRYIAEKAKAGDGKFALTVDALAYQIACEIGSRSMAMKGEIDAIILTGGLANSDYLCNLVRSKTEWLAKVIIVPGEDELQALAEGVYRVLSKEEEAKVYVSEQ